MVMTELRYEVLVHDGVRRHRAQRLPDGSPIVSSPLASTLIVGEHDAVLVDPPFTREQVARVGDWIERSGRRLAYIYSTHGHGDHWFGTGELARRFPGATVCAGVTVPARCAATIAATVSLTRCPDRTKTAVRKVVEVYSAGTARAVSGCKRERNWRRA